MLAAKVRSSYGPLAYFSNIFISGKNKQVDHAPTYLQLPLRQWGAGNVYLLVLSSWKVNIAENPIAVMAHYAKIQKYEQGKIGLQFFDMWC